MLVLMLASLSGERGMGTTPLTWQPGEGYRWTDLPVPGPGKTGFTLMAPETTGITFTNRLSADRSITNQIHLNGSGVALGDVDGDGWCDIYLCGLDGPNALYRNLGNWKFEDIAETAGVACPELDATGATLADLDGDGDLDLIVNSVGGGTHVFLNDGQGHFRRQAVLNSGRCGTSMALADIDGDGDLDLYVANYRTVTLRDAPQTKFRVNIVDGLPVITRVNDRPVTEPDLVGRFQLDPRGRIIEFGEPDELYRNDGGANFTALSFTNGTFLDEAGKPLREPLYDWGLSVMFRDLNGDGAPDLYVCNDFDPPDRIWINSGKGQFRPADRFAFRTTPMFAMGLDIADVNRDGFDDVFVSDMFSRFHRIRMTQVGDILPTYLEIGRIDDRPQYSRNTLSLNRGDGTYAEIGQYSGLEASEWTWCPVFLDVDLDGYEDLLVTTGHERDAMNADIANQKEVLKQRRPMSPLEQVNLNRMYPRLATLNVAFRNRGDLTFEEVGKAWGYDTTGVSQGQALADLDNDGDLDVVMNNLNGAAGVYRNGAAAPRLAVRLRGAPPNTRGIGAKIRVTGGPVPQGQEMIAGGRYLSSDDPMRVFAAGSLTNDLTIEVTWRSGKQSVVRHAQANGVFEIEEPSAIAPVAPPPAPAAPPWFEEVSELVRYSHHDENFDDYARQPLLPKKLSQLGPGVSWYDWNGDGWEDLCVGTGRGGRMGCFLNDGKGGFQRVTAGALGQQVLRDQTTLLGWQQTPGAADLLAGVATYEEPRPSGASVRRYNFPNGTVDDALAAQEWSAGALALADYDGDGDLDLFVGGRCGGGRYPAPASSLLVRNRGGVWEVDADNVKPLDHVGLVSGAVWSDLDADGWPDLVLACEWGPVRVFHNDRGALKEITDELGLGDRTGWWNGVTTGDLDGDGSLDIVATNWGRNTKYRASQRNPRRLYYGSLDGSETVSLIEAFRDETLGKEVPDREFRTVLAALPFLSEKIPTYEAYANGSVEDLFGETLKQMAVVEANTLETLVFFNRGGRFVGMALPREAQLAPGFGVVVGDMDGDGREDVFLSQNFFAVNPDYWRHDAGRGLWLKGDGKGGLSAVPGQVSGVKVYGEQRGCALADYDGDGRVDLAVAQNGNALKLYRNRGARPGLRVRLQGPPGNPTGVGAGVRLGSGGKWGPLREIHAGSGYWSQDSAIQVLSTASAPTQISVRWPGGKTTTNDLPAGAAEIAVTDAGQVVKVR